MYVGLHIVQNANNCFIKENVHKQAKNKNSFKDLANIKKIR